MAERVSRGVDGFARRQALARLVSHLTNPALIAIPLVLGVAWRSTATWGEALRWGSLYLLLGDVCPMALLIVLARRGWVTDLERARRRERLKPLLVSVGFVGLTAAMYRYAGAPPLLRRLAWVQLVQAVLMMAITPFWQISFHGAAAGALAAMALLLYGVGTWPLLALLPLVGWAQVERGRHTAGQVVAGALLSALVYGLGFGP